MQTLHTFLALGIHSARFPQCIPRAENACKVCIIYTGSCLVFRELRCIPRAAMYSERCDVFRELRTCASDQDLLATRQFENCRIHFVHILNKNIVHRDISKSIAKFFKYHGASNFLWDIKIMSKIFPRPLQKYIIPLCKW